MILRDRSIALTYTYLCVKRDVRVSRDCDLLSKNSNIGMDTVKRNEIKSTLIICDNKYCSFEYGQIISVH